MRVETFDRLLSRARAVRVARRAPEWIIPAVKSSLVVMDVALAAASFIVAFYVRQEEPVIARSSDGSLVWSREFAPYGAVLVTCPHLPRIAGQADLCNARKDWFRGA